MDRLHPSSPPRTTAIVTRPITSTSPVEIPHAKHKTVHGHKPRAARSHAHIALQEQTYRTRSPSQPHPGDARKTDHVPPSVASLLAVTSIPPPRRRGSRRASKELPLTVDSIIEKAQVAEKTLSLTLGGKSPMELLLSAPEELEEDDDLSICDSTAESVTMSTRTISLESMPSLVDSVSTATLSSVDSPPNLACCRPKPMRRSLEPIAAPGDNEEHPLFSPNFGMDKLDFRVFERQDEEQESLSMFRFRPLKSAFKSNLTASLKAIKSAAKSFSSLNFSSIPPEDFLTRSLLAIDPAVPYTDERRPPVMEADPPAAVRRYLNPMPIAREDAPANNSSRPFTASIQMQTYKVQRSRSLPPPVTRIGSLSSSPPASNKSSQPSQGKAGSFSYPPGPRALRENSDFIRIAVMEMAMRRRGKLSDETPGHARLALPPRKSILQPYEVGVDGVPLRWVPLLA